MNILYSTKFEKHLSLNTQIFRAGYSKIDVKQTLFYLCLLYISFLSLALSFILLNVLECLDLAR